MCVIYIGHGFTPVHYTWNNAFSLDSLVKNLNVAVHCVGTETLGIVDLKQFIALHKCEHLFLSTIFIGYNVFRNKIKANIRRHM